MLELFWQNSKRLEPLPIFAKTPIKDVSQNSLVYSGVDDRATATGLIPIQLRAIKNENYFSSACGTVSYIYDGGFCEKSQGFWLLAIFVKSFH